ncbi:MULTISPECIES: DUF4197 domain-containing protein [Aequorivita]|uniref:DUF4197 domain-containing protein n=1 Tax=Aequorivita iocasae TaxID=2803865 RepID=A0ABX7DST7_9FLAO|nr:MULTISPECIES: DUF4197 domain-containing protein [Aequorivita]QQX76885.1 DUF4197 domain-containing protein [Aequorivita iocasae]UCA56359.1 DUF4197 domain-containing protein [Aequorivita sp. F7]
MWAKKIFLCCAILTFFSCAELQQVVNTLPNQTGSDMNPTMIANGLRQALDLGIDKQVTKLTKKDGFYKNPLVKILLPPELQKVDQGLRDIGLGSLADEGIKALNRAAEDAVKEATPIFVSAVKEITFVDAKNILLGPDNAATHYLEQRTSTALYSKFEPVIKNSFSRVGADQIWTSIITKYNSIPFVTKANPNLTDYVTTEALQGVYKMISVEEKDIRNNISARTTALLRQVFALQD